jgi:hypothetical protein
MWLVQLIVYQKNVNCRHILCWGLQHLLCNAMSFGCLVSFSRVRHGANIVTCAFFSPYFGHRGLEFYIQDLRLKPHYQIKAGTATKKSGDSFVF